MSVLLEKYRKEVCPQLMKSRGYANVNQVPKLTKIVINSGVSTSKDRDTMEEVLRTLGDITGQPPVVTKSRKSIAAFKLRQGQNVGAKVTLRGRRMYDFFYRLVNVALPRVRDFRGVSPKAFDGHGNYSMGVSDQTIFTEVNLDKMKHTVGFDVIIVTTAKSNEEGLELLTLLGVPFAH
jgi:large subunit ribosomal protein L5